MSDPYEPNVKCVAGCVHPQCVHEPDTICPCANIIDWLWSPEGLQWAHDRTDYVHHSAGIFGEVKNDHECALNRCDVMIRNNNQYPDSVIYSEKITRERTEIQP